MLKRQTLTSQAVEYILNLIKSGQVPPGGKLPTEKELTEQLGVSRTCVREAMKSLESLKMISVRPKVGAVVLEPSPAALFSTEQLSTAAYQQTTDSLIEFRRILEVGLASLAAQKSDAADLAAMEKAIQQHREAIHTGQRAYPADMAFHAAIARASRNPIAIMVFDMISEPLTEQRRRTNDVPNAAEDGLRDHLLIFSAIKEGSPEKARNMMRAHMDTAEHYYRLATARQRDGASAGVMLN
jgi:GntR family transcriptional regulator, transcriptional repressor for pyruvate dehydrogenase complex